MRKNTIGKPVDTVCGHVKGKSVSGGDTQDKPPLYLVKEDEAYVVDGPDSAAASVWRNICDQLRLGEKTFQPSRNQGFVATQ